MSGNDSVLTGSCGCPPTENLNNKPGTQHDVAEPIIINDGHFVDDRSRHNTWPIRDRHAPIQYGDPVIDYVYSPNHCFSVCPLDCVCNVNTVPRAYKQAMSLDEKPQWTGAMQRNFDTLVKIKWLKVVDSIHLINYIKFKIAKKYNIAYLGSLKFFLGIEFLQEKGLVQMSLSKYCKSIIERFDMKDCNPVKAPCESPVLREAKKFRELVHLHSRYKPADQTLVL